MSTEFPSSTPPGERREGLPDRRMPARSPIGDRRLSSKDHGSASTRDGMDLRPPLAAGDAAPPTEDVQLLFERS